MVIQILLVITEEEEFPGSILSVKINLENNYWGNTLTSLQVFLIIMTH